MSSSCSKPPTRNDSNSLTYANSNTREVSSSSSNLPQGRFGDLEHSPSSSFATSSRSSGTLLERPRQLSPTPSQASTTIPDKSQRPVPDSPYFALSPPPGFEGHIRPIQEEPTISFERRGSRDDPTKAFRGSPAPFFMLSPSYEPPFASSSVSSDGTVMAREASWNQKEPQSTWDRGEGAGGLWQDQGNVGMREKESREVDGAAQETADGASEQIKVELAQLANLSASLDHKVRYLSDTVNTLHHRVRHLEQSSLDKDRHLEGLRNAIETMSIRRQQRDNSPFEQPPYMFPQEDPYMAEMTPPGSTRHRSSSSSVAFSDESIPPSHRRTASMPVRPYPMQPLFYPSQPPLSSEYLHLAQLDAMSPPHSHSRGQNFAPPPRQLPPMSPAYLVHNTSATNHQPFSRPGPNYASSHESMSFGMRSRPGIAPLQNHSRTSSSGEWNVNEDMPSPGSSKVGSDSFSGPVYAPSSVASSSSCLPPVQSQPMVNYRTLLETDDEIDDEVFIRRIYLQNDQQCSLFLQQRVKTTSPERKRRLLEAVGDHLIELSTSKFGNFLVSRCLEAGDATIAQMYSSNLSDRFLELSLDPFGCHVVQKLLDCSDTATKVRVIDELAPFPNTLMNKNSCHVWNRLLTQPNPPAFYRRLAEVGTGSWSAIVRDDGGSLIVQHLLEDWNEVHSSIVAREILENLEDVATTACGSFVLIAFVEKNVLPFRARVLELAPRLAIDTFGAKIVERVLKSGKVASKLMTEFIESIISISDGEQEPLLLAVASHVSGANLLAYLLTTSVAPYNDKAKLVRCITSHAPKLLAEGGAHSANLVGLVGKA